MLLTNNHIRCLISVVIIITLFASILCFITNSMSITIIIVTLIYRIRKFPGQIEATLTAEVEFNGAEKKSWIRPPIQMEFQVLSSCSHYCRCILHKRRTRGKNSNGICFRVRIRMSIHFVRLFYLFWNLW